MLYRVSFLLSLLDALPLILECLRFLPRFLHKDTHKLGTNPIFLGNILISVKRFFSGGNDFFDLVWSKVLTPPLLQLVVRSLLVPCLLLQLLLASSLDVV